LRILVAQKLLQEVFGHPFTGQPMGDRMPKKVRIDAVCDLCVLCPLLNDLLDTLGGMVHAVGRCKDGASAPIAQVQA
jgi:hypothetical protein